MVCFWILYSVSSVLLLVPHGIVDECSFHPILFFLPLWNIYFCSAIIDMIKTNAENCWVYWVRSVILLFFTSSLERVLNHFCQVLETDPVWILGLNIYINLGKITVFAEYLPVTDKIHNFKQNNNNVTVRKPGWLITEGEIEIVIKRTACSSRR